MTYCIYHWDTFEPPGEDLILLATTTTLEEAEEWVAAHYGSDASEPGQRLRANGADRIDIVLNGEVIQWYRVG